jgi:hypothetical protein
VTSSTPSPLRGERVGVRGETFDCYRRSTADALTPSPLPSTLEGEREPGAGRANVMNVCEKYGRTKRFHVFSTDELGCTQ